MTFPVPQPSVTHGAAPLSREQLANEASADRRAAQIRHALSRSQQPQMVTTSQPRSEADLARQRSERIRLRGNRSVDYRQHLDALLHERQDASERLASYRRQREAALRQGHVHDAKTLGGYIEDLTLVLEQMSLLEADAREGLAAAEEREARLEAARQSQIPQAEKDYAAFLKLRADYDQHAKAIATIVAAEPAAEAARRILVDAGREPSPLPVGPDGKALRSSVTLPGHCSPPRRMPTAADAYSR